MSYFNRELDISKTSGPFPRIHHMLSFLVPDHPFCFILSNKHTHWSRRNFRRKVPVRSFSRQCVTHRLFCVVYVTDFTNVDQHRFDY